MAVSDEAWDLESVQPVYERFLSYLEQNICETSEEEPVIGKKFFLQAHEQQIYLPSGGLPYLI